MIVSIFFSDSGIGIEKEYQKKIFNRFYKVEDQNKVLYRGAGLGLFLTQKNIELLSGSISLESEYGAGSTFHFSIPAPDIRIESIERAKVSSYNYQSESIKVHSALIVEDDVASMTLLNQIMFPVVGRLYKAELGKKAVNIFTENRNIDVVLLDIQLPDINGFEVLKQLRYINPKVKVIAQTAYVSEKDKKLCYTVGFDGYLSKPIVKKKLLDLIDILFETT